MNAKDKYRISFACKLDKIIQQNNYMIELLESDADKSMLAASLQQRLTAKNNMIRQLEYEQWFKEHNKQ